MKSTFTTDKGKSESAHRTDEAGEPSHGTPSRESALLVTESFEGKASEQWAPNGVYTKLERIAERARERPDEVISIDNPVPTVRAPMRRRSAVCHTFGLSDMKVLAGMCILRIKVTCVLV